MENDKHKVEFMGGERPTAAGAAIYPHITCESGAEVQVSQVVGGAIFSLDLKDGNALDSFKGPMFVDCAKHGSYLGFVQLLSRGVNTGHGPNQQAVSLPLLLIPLTDVEYVLPESLK